MKSLVSLVLVGLVGIAYGQINTNCVVQCRTVGTAEGCPANSLCKLYTSTNSQMQVCACGEGFEAKCNASSNTNTPSMWCSPRTTTGCGNAFPNGCPSTTTCVTTATAGQICVCSDATLRYDPNTQTCVSPCPENAHLTINGGCECNDGFVRDTANGRCVPRTQVTCDTINCPTGYVCVNTATAGPQCVVDRNNTNVVRCGYGFQCASTQVCVDTTTGPKCICPQNYGGVDCTRPLCWRLESTGSFGCWWPNSSADCLVDPNSINPPYCVCRPGSTGPRCDITDTRCANVDCSTKPNTICKEGRCVCAPGYVLDSTTNSARCVIALPPVCRNVTCNGNLICVAQGTAESQCICNNDVYSASDCSKPRCATDADCGTNAYCVVSTRTSILPFCACKPGWTGPECNTSTTTCDATRCPNQNFECNNEGRCVCKSGFTGVDCRSTDSNANCLTITITLSPNVDFPVETIRRKIAELLKIDVVNIKVDPPVRTSDGRVQFTFTICGDANVDSAKANEAFFAAVSSGNTNGLSIDSAVQGTPEAEDSSSDASAIKAFFGLAVFVVAFLF